MHSFFSHLFRKQSTLTAPSHDPTPPFAQDVHIESSLQEINQTEPAIKVVPDLKTPQYIVGVAQAIGIQRDTNEDSVFTLTTNLISKDANLNFGLYIIADGMGGHENGELASRLAVDTLASHLINAFYLPSISSLNQPLDESIQDVMKTGVMNAHKAIREKALGSGTTLTTALLLGDQMTIAHVGDSRAYLIDHNGKLQLLTHDHSVVKRLEEIGQITSEEASTHPNRNLLYRALGQGEQFEPDVTSLQICPSCELLLCSDGLWGVVSESEIMEILGSSSEPQLVCQSLINAANAAGGPDNISVIIVRFPEIN